ncbi:hydroxymethylglutaryl-CoA lyase [Sphingomonas oryzagri]
MANLPRRVRICEEGPREGFQMEPPTIATAEKIRLIEALAGTGLGDIACCSFVSPTRVPQMADAEAIVAGIHRRPGVRYTGLWLNRAGFERAEATSLDLNGLIVASASETFGIRNNNRDREGMRNGQRELMAAYGKARVTTIAGYVFTAFGCNYEGPISPDKVVAAVEDILTVTSEAGVLPEVVYLCDTVGAATPVTVERAIGTVRDRWPDLPLGLHLHDTRGIGMANALVGLQLGIDRFDTSIGGLGGCPFAGNRAAAGNLCTEDLAYLCEEMGIETGVDLDALIDAANLAESIVGHPLPGKLRQVGRPAR